MAPPSKLKQEKAAAGGSANPSAGVGTTLATPPAGATAQVSIVRGPPVDTNFIIAKTFFIGTDLLQEGFLDIVFSPIADHRRSVRVILDLVLLAGLPKDSFTEYLVALDTEEDEKAMVDRISFGEGTCFSNMLHLGRVGFRSETTFSLVSFGEWDEVARKVKSQNLVTISSRSALVVYSTPGFQKQLVSQILLQIR